MSPVVAKVGGLLIATPVVIYMLLMFSLQFMPGCEIGSGGPANYCNLLGINLYLLLNWMLVGVIAGFFTIPLGVLILIIFAIFATKK